jgi:nicotinamide-nucleotide amidase
MQSDAAKVLAALEQRGWKLAIAESLTGGLLAAEFVAVPGASKVLLGSITAYQNSIKENILDVPAGDLENFGAVSAEVAEAMALGVQQKFATEHEPVVGISTTGVAGPDADGDKPVGLVYVGLALPGLPVQSFELKLDGSRAEIRTAAVQSAVSELLEQIGN